MKSELRTEVEESGYLHRDINPALDLFEEIRKLKKEKNAIILAHYYQDDEIQDIADFRGDSLGLAQQAEKTNADMIAFAGVHFMAETAKLLNPHKKVVLPDLRAGCSLSDSCPPDTFKTFKEQHPGHVVISYINCTAEIKTLSDIICTSSNAVKIVDSVPADKKVIFAPDKNLGAYIQKKTGREMVLWNGTCMVHEIFSLDKIMKLKLQHPQAKIIAHPECEEHVLAVADFIGSTTALLKYTMNDRTNEFIVVTEPGIIHQMQLASPDKTFLPAPPDNNCACNECPHMKLNTLEKLYLCMKYEVPEVIIPEHLAQRALLPLKKNVGNFGPPRIMKSKFLITAFTLLFLFQSGFSQKPNETNPNGYNKFYHANGALSSEGNLVNGKPDGIWKAYYDTGVLKSEGNRVNGKLEGLWKFYNETGIISAEYTYKEGTKNGSQKEHYASGKIMSDENFINGIKSGPAKYFDETGFMSKELNFENGVENGTGKVYASDGRIISILTYKNGALVKDEKINRKDKFNFKQGVWKEFFANGKVKTESNYTDDLLEGTFRYFNEDGSVRKMEVYRKGELVVSNRPDVKLEIDRDYHNNGRVKSSVNLIDGVKQGVYREYSREGKITASKMYRNDEVVGEGLVDENMLYQGIWKFFYPGGKLKSEGEFKDGQRIGLWKFYYENGNIEQTGNYVNGKPDGEWKWYFISGKLLREEVYRRGKEDGMMKEYNENGNTIAEGNYYEGMRDGLWKFKSASYTAEGGYTDGRETGKWKGFFDNGKTAFEGSYFDGNENGEHRYYYDNGKLREVRNYKLGLPDGEWRSYDITGELILTTTFRAGEEIKFDGNQNPVTLFPRNLFGPIAVKNLSN